MGGLTPRHFVFLLSFSPISSVFYLIFPVLTCPPPPPRPSTGVGVALFDDGALVRNVLTSELTWSWKLSMWGSAPVPPPASPPDAPCWAPFAERASSYLSRLDAAFSPDVIILGGAAGVTARSWAPLVTGVRARLLPAQLGPESGVIGAACGGAVQIALRDDLLRVRSAIGMAVGRSPARLSKRALRLVFNKLDADASGLVTPAELAAAVNALGVSVPAAQLRETFLDIDAEGTGRISFDAFANWWADFGACCALLSAVAGSGLSPLFAFFLHFF